MKMGRERDVLRWDIHVALLRQQIEQTQAELARLPGGAESTSGGHQRQRAEQLTAKLDELRHQLRAFGPSPRAKMG